jgi:hypothetical protein
MFELSDDMMTLKNLVYAFMDTHCDPSHDSSHLQRVCQNVKELFQCSLDYVDTELTGISYEYCILMALLHDVIDTKYFHGDTTENLRTLTQGLKFRNMDFSNEDQVRCFVAKLNKARWSYFYDHKTELVDTYVHVLRYADWLDAIGPEGIARTFFYNATHYKLEGSGDTPMRAVLRHYNKKLKWIQPHMHFQTAHSRLQGTTLNNYFKELQKNLDEVKTVPEFIKGGAMKELNSSTEKREYTNGWEDIPSHKLVSIRGSN